jgi:hypothetical protein
MGWLRRITVWALLTVFFSSFLLLAYGWTLNETFGRREVVKQWFENSGAYDNFVTEITVLSQSQALEAGNIIDGATLETAANAGFTPEILQQGLEDVLDGTYDWLEGETTDLTFEIDFTESKQAYAQALTDAAAVRVETLQPCVKQTTGAFDPFSAPCRPVGLDFGPLEDGVKQLVLEDENFLPDPVISASDITVNKDGSPQTISEAASYLPLAYKIARFGPFIAILLTFASGIGLVAIASSKRKGVFKIFRGFAFTAASLAVFTYISGHSTDWLDRAFAVDPSARGITERIIKPVVGEITSDLTRWTSLFMIIYGVLAAVTLLIYIIMRRMEVKQGEKTLPEDPRYQPQ